MNIFFKVLKFHSKQIRHKFTLFSILHLLGYNKMMNLLNDYKPVQQL